MTDLSPSTAELPSRHNALNSLNVLSSFGAPDRVAVATWNVHHLGKLEAPTGNVAGLLRSLLDTADALDRVLQGAEPLLVLSLDLPPYDDWRRNERHAVETLLELYRSERGPAAASHPPPETGDAHALLEYWKQLQAHAGPEVRRTREKLDIARHCVLLFHWNPWLDALVLQEVRSGVDIIEAEVRQWNLRGNDKLELVRGPLLVSSGGSGQEEFYPILFRKKRIWGCRYWGAVTTGGEVDTREKITWEKKEHTYRPTVVYELSLRHGYDLFRVGVVHTTPGEASTEQTRSANQATDDEMQREDQYRQVEPLFRKVAAQDPVFCPPLEGGGTVHWIIGGDYYVGAEAQVLSPGLTLGTRGLPYDSIATHEVYQSGELEALADQELAKRGIRVADIPAALDKLKERKAFAVGEGGRADGLRQKATGEWAATSPAYLQALRLLKLKLWVHVVRKETEPLHDAYVSRSGASVVRHEAGLSFVKRLPRGLRIVQTVSGTNWHDASKLLDPLPASPGGRASRWATARVADFFVVSETFVFGSGQPGGDVSLAGLLAPGGGLLLADTEDLAASRYWVHRSDHFPVCCYLALAESAAAPIREAVRAPAAVRSAETLARELDRLQEDAASWRLWRLLDFVWRTRGVENLASVRKLVEEKGWAGWIVNFASAGTDRFAKLRIDVDAVRANAAIRELSDALWEVQFPMLDDAAPLAPGELGQRLAALASGSVALAALHPAVCGVLETEMVNRVTWALSPVEVGALDYGASTAQEVGPPPQ